MILADDLAPGCTGFEGNPLARTPNLDRLAREGVCLRRAYVSVPQCTPSRASILLGLYPHRTGALSNQMFWDRSRTTLAQVLGAAGYRTGMIGKWHLGKDSEPQAGFEEHWCALDADEQTYFDPLLWVDGESQREKGYVPSVLTDRALAFMDEDDARPFFLWLAYTSPHEPLSLPPRPVPRHPGEMTLPASMADDLSEKPKAQRESDAHRIFNERDPQMIRRVLAVYQAMVDALDLDIGRLLDHLDRRGLAEDTLVVFLSDNGTLRGEHRMATKGPAFYEELVRTPFVVRWPGVVPSSREITGLVSSLDLFPTLARVAGAEAPPDLDGKDFWPLVRGTVGEVHSELYFEYARKNPGDPPTAMLGLVTLQQKYVHYLDTNEEELYDLQRDPLELENLARSPSAPLEGMRQRVESFRVLRDSRRYRPADARR